MLGLAAAPVGHAQSAPAYFDLKPAGYTSYICANGDNSFTSDPSFAGYAAGALISNGVARVKDAEFVFDSCYGGGFLSTLSTSLGSTVPWVGGAGGRYDQTVSGNNSGGLYVLPLNSSLAADYQANGAGSSTPFVNELNYAHDNDSAGPAGGATQSENPQTIYANGGDTAKFNDVGLGGSHYAIFWAGIVDPNKTEEYIGFRKDVDNLYARMNESWGAASSYVYVLYGNGQDDGHGTSLQTLYGGTNNTILQATDANLQTVFTAIGSKITANDQFFFFSGDHGSSDKPVDGYPITLNAGGTRDIAFRENQDEADDFAQNPNVQGHFTVSYSIAGAQPGDVTLPAAPVPAPPLPLVMLSNTYSQGALSLALFASTPYAGRVIVYAARPALAGNNLYKKGAFKVIGSLPSLVQGGNSISALYAAKYRVPSEGYEVAVKLVGVTSHGFRTSEMLLTNIVGASAQAAHEAADKTVLKVA